MRYDFQLQTLLYADTIIVYPDNNYTLHDIHFMYSFTPRKDPTDTFNAIGIHAIL